MGRRASVKRRSAPFGPTGSLLAASLALVAGGCGAVVWREPATQGTPCEVAARSGMTGEADAALAKLVAARRTGEAEVVPGVEFLVSPFTLTNLLTDKPAILDGTVAIPWNDAYEPSTALDIQVVLKRPPRGAASLASGDTFVIFRFSAENYSGQDVTFNGSPGAPANLSVLGFWVDGRTVLDRLAPRSNWRPYLQYGGGLAKYGKVDHEGTMLWTPDSLEYSLGWHIRAGMEWRRGKLGVYVEYGAQAIAPPPLDEQLTDPAIAPQAVAGQDLVTFPLRIGGILAF